MARKSDRPVIYVAGGYASGFVAQAIKAEAERTGARIVGKLDLPRSVPPIAPDMLARIMCDGRAAAPQPTTAAPRDPARERTWAELRAAAPMRANAEQQDAAHLPLFVHANEPKFI